MAEKPNTISMVSSPMWYEISISIWLCSLSLCDTVLGTGGEGTVKLGKLEVATNVRQVAVKCVKSKDVQESTLALHALVALIKHPSLLRHVPPIVMVWAKSVSSETSARGALSFHLWGGQGSQPGPSSQSKTSFRTEYPQLSVTCRYKKFEVAPISLTLACPQHQSTASTISVTFSNLNQTQPGRSWTPTNFHNMNKFVPHIQKLIFL